MHKLIDKNFSFPCIFQILQENIFPYQEEADVMFNSSLINEISIRDLTDRNESWKRKLLYNFYIRELRSYLDSEKEEIKYYCKDRAKAKLPIIIEMDETSGNKKLIPIVIKDGKDNIELYSRSTQVFMKEHINVSPINVPAPTYNQLQESSSLYNRIKNIT